MTLILLLSLSGSTAGPERFCSGADQNQGKRFHQIMHLISSGLFNALLYKYNRDYITWLSVSQKKEYKQN